MSLLSQATDFTACAADRQGCTVDNKCGMVVLQLDLLVQKWITSCFLNFILYCFYVLDCACDKEMLPEST